VLIRALKLFVSSPGDLAPERALVQRVVQAINADFPNVLRIDVIRWEEKSYSAKDSFQAQIMDPSESDLVIALLNQRMGTPLPLELASRADGSAYESGTAYEIETSLAHERAHGSPQTYVFRKTLEQAVSAVDPSQAARSAVEQNAEQARALAAFWQRLFVDANGSILRAFQSFTDADDLSLALDRCIRGWLAERGYLRDAPRWNSALLGSPFRGLEAFEENHAGVFFGRSAAIDLALERLLNAKLLLILGASGAGKSSLCKAGIVPRFRELMNAHGPERARVISMRAGAGLTHTLFAALQTEFPDLPEQWRSCSLPPEMKYLLVVDQFEEALTQSAEETLRFAEQLSALLEQGFLVLASMRADCYGDLLDNVALSALKDRGASMDLRAPGIAEFEEMIRAPAAAAKLVFERDESGVDLAQRILQDLAGSDALALMQLCLSRLFVERVGQTLSIASYLAMGGVQGAIASDAERTFLALPATAQAELPGFLAEIVADFSDSGEALCRAAVLHPDAESAARREFINQFAAARLLIKDGALVRVAHEALVRAWPRSVQGLSDVRDVLQLRARLQAPLKEWRENPSALLAAQPLLFSAKAILAGESANLLGLEEREFVQASHLAHQHARSKQLRWIVGIAAVLAVLAIVAVVMAWQAKQAQAQARTSFAASVDGINTLTRDLAKSLRQARGVRAETVESVLNKAQTMVASIEATDPGNIDLEFARIGMLIGFSDTYRTVARSKEANAALEVAAKRLIAIEKLAGADARANALRLELNLAQSQQAETSLDLNVAERFARQALVLAAKDPAASLHARYRVAKILFLQNKLSEIDALYQSAKDTEIADPDAELRALRLEFAALQMEAQNALGKTSEAYVLRSLTLVELTIALKQEPNSADLQEIALRLQRQEANDQLRDNQTQAAIETISTAIGSARASVQDNPNNARLRLMTKRLLNLRAQIYRSQKEIGAELLDLRESVRLLTEISARDPEQLFLRAEVSFANRRLSEALLFFANASEKQGQMIESNYLIEAQKAAMASVDIDRGLLSLSPTRPFARRYLSSSLEQLGLIRRQQTRLNEALVLLRESLQIRLDLAEEFPSEFAWFHLSAISYSRLKDLHRQRLENGEALSAQRSATGFFHKAYLLATDRSSLFSWFNSSLRLAEMAYSADQKAEADAIMHELQAVARTHEPDFSQRADLIEDLQRITRQQAIR
jgi:hypothetical protein